MHIRLIAQVHVVITIKGATLLKHFVRCISCYRITLNSHNCVWQNVDTYISKLNVSHKSFRQDCFHRLPSNKTQPISSVVIYLSVTSTQ